MQPKTGGFAAGTFAASLTSTGMIAQQVAGKAVRDALFLSVYQVKHLPHAMAAASVLSLAVVAGLPAITTRVPPRRLLPCLFGASAVGLVLEWLLYSHSRHLGAIVLYVHVSVFAPVIISTFWSLINERFDPHTAKREVARIAGGGTLGGVLGGLAAWRASTLVSVPSAILILAAINVACLGAVLTMRAPVIESRPSFVVPDEPPTLSALRLFRHAPFLRNLAILVCTGSAMSSVLDYVLGVQAVEEFGRGPNLLAFFSLFGLAVSVLSLLLQVSFGRIAMEKLNLAVHLAVLPGVVIMGGAVGLAVPGIVTTAILRGAEMVHRNTLFRSAYELLYTPIPELHKRATKALIDVGFDRAGTIVGSLVTMLVVFVVVPVHARSQTVLLGIVVLGALSTLPLVRSLHHNYVDALEQSLRVAAAQVAEGPEERIPHSIAPEAELDRDALLHTVAQLDPRPDDHGFARETLANPRPLSQLGMDLLSGDDVRAGRALQRFDANARPLASAALLHLANPKLHLVARTSLRLVGAKITGQLVDAMLDPEMDFVVRRRIPAILVVSPSQRAADGLFLALADPRFEVRYAASRALMRMLERTPGILLPRESIVSTILAEIAREQEYADTLSDDELAGDADLEPLDVVTRDRVSRGLEHLFNELAILLGSAAVKICFRALHDGDDRARGTALEYLQTVLPDELRDAIWPLLGEESALPALRPAADVLADLARALEKKEDQKTDTPLPAPPS